MERRRQKKGKWFIAMEGFLRVAICVSAALLAVVLIWHFAGPALKSARWRDGDGMGQAGSTSAPLTFLPQYEDGSGQAGIALYYTGMEATYETPGWQRDGEGWWYACDDATCYANGWAELDGTRYHFDARGYMSSGGWVPIGGKGCYFDERGILQPDMDSSHMIALTFDDGPGEYTAELLDILEENKVCASFMVLGEMVEQHGEETLPRMLKLGCTVGNHSYDHANLVQLSLDEAKEQFSRTDQLVADATGGWKPTVIRFPYGNYNQELADATGRPCFYWDLDTADWSKATPAEVKAAVESQVFGGCIVLMHDVYYNTVQACRDIIPDLIEDGYELVSLETLAAARGFELKAGVTYFGFSDREIANGTATDA